jgi:hypothetical protein
MHKNNTSELLPDTIIMGERNYEAAIDIVLAQAKKELLIFDQDFENGAFSSVNRYERLNQFLTQPEATKLTIILHDAHFFLHNCPRLVNLLKAHGHKMVVYTTNNAAKIAKDCFIIADQQAFIRRIHIDHARFKYSFTDNETINSLAMRFDELLDETETQLSTIHLGL